MEFFWSVYLKKKNHLSPHRFFLLTKPSKTKTFINSEKYFTKYFSLDLKNWPIRRTAAKGSVSYPTSEEAMWAIDQMAAVTAAASFSLGSSFVSQSACFEMMSPHNWKRRFTPRLDWDNSPNKWGGITEDSVNPNIKKEFACVNNLQWFWPLLN